MTRGAVRTGVALLALGCALALWPSWAKKKKEDETQILQLPKELPNAVVGDTRRVVFYTSPLSAKGLLSQQIRDGLKALERQAAGSTILQIRAFVAGTGDLRRVRDLVSETFTERHQPLPALSLVQAGGLPMTDAQVLFEAAANANRDANPGGLAFISAQTAVSSNPLDPVAPLLEKSLAGLQQAIRAFAAEPADMLRVTCFLSSLDGLDPARAALQAAFPRASASYIQTQRGPLEAVASCEGVAGLRGEGSGIELLNPAGLNAVSGESQIAKVATPHIVFTGSQVSFGSQDADARLALERLQKTLESTGASRTDIAFARFYPLSGRIEEQVRRVRAAFFDAAHPPAASFIQVEGLPSTDAGFAAEVVAGKQ